MELIGTTKTAEDYVVELKRPDGVIVKVLIPIEGVDKRLDEVLKHIAASGNSALGLNFVSDGHYT